jgi:hypothetical protein
MSGAASARDAIRKMLTASYKPIYAAGKDYALAYQRALTPEDLVETLAHAIDVVLAAAHLREVAEAAEKDARAELARQMQDVGCFNIHSGEVSAHLQRKQTVLSIDDPKLIPSEYLIQPPPVPDRKRIRDAIEAGADVPGASIIIPNDRTLSIRRSSK